MSPSSRRAWIEIAEPSEQWTARAVALLAEGVDRNRCRAAGADPGATVALLAEGVDRNGLIVKAIQSYLKSPSSRRAWIEMCPV